MSKGTAPKHANFSVALSLRRALVFSGPPSDLVWRSNCSSMPIPLGDHLALAQWVVLIAEDELRVAPPPWADA